MALPACQSPPAAGTALRPMAALQCQRELRSPRGALRRGRLRPHRRAAFDPPAARWGWDRMEPSGENGGETSGGGETCGTGGGSENFGEGP